MLHRFYLARLLARVFHHDPDSWVLKGGQALLVRYSDARHSRDVDLMRPAVVDVDAAIAQLIAAVGQDLGDLLVFRHRDTARATGDGCVTTVRFDLRVGNTPLTTISVDVVFDRAPVGAHTIRRLDTIIDLSGMEDVPGLAICPEVRLYPLQDHLADKICAMVEQRVAAFVDLLLGRTAPGRRCPVQHGWQSN
ncbi:MULTISPECIES: nucleotidyl transferase AbiEii/AbiGii toxin family protein [Actinosynnema]|uniref:nucleotidyl transferase AbiEii/AbiGii toxin family protein n=1 Tax=Actinosynnema TaxID=40566 RepID=UPI0020A6179D|nr:nucleotidyl transferase AbiEii/AbiGii toxin family protein [Actinosynnema pretiosum]MCP2095996.1 Nucleotidyl transferase AbiEii toxin, Type IV TA system [Actinosynnema pretiosum]